MNESASSGALVPSRAVAREMVERRRQLIKDWYFVEGVTQFEIMRRLAALDPPIVVKSQSHISKDIEILRSQIRTTFGNRDRFKAEEYIHRRVRRHEKDIEMCRKIAEDTAREPSERMIALRLANESARLQSDLLVDCGLLGPHVAARMIAPVAEEDGDRKLPGAAEIAKLVDSVQVLEGELVSDAELAWKYGDAAASTAAAMSADDTNGKESGVPATEATEPASEENRADDSGSAPARIPSRRRIPGSRR